MALNLGRDMPTNSVFFEYNLEERESSLHGAALIGSFDEVGPGDHAGAPHRHQFVELAWLNQGSGTHTIDTTSVPIAPGSLHIITPGQVHSWDPGTEAVDGTLVLFKEAFLAELGTPLPHLTGGVAIPDSHTAARIDRIIAELRIEIHSNAADRKAVVRHLLAVLVALCARENLLPAHPQSPLTAEFQKVVRSNVSAKLTVRECAARLHVTTTQLTDAVKADLGRTPGEYIRSQVTLEAKRMLSRTALSSAQISARLGFDDPSYFSRFFRRESGRSTSEYRAHHGARL